MAAKYTVNDTLNALIQKGKEADDQMKSWAAIKKDASEKILEQLEGAIEVEKTSLEGKTSLTTSIELYDAQGVLVLTVTGIGRKIILDQVKATELAERNPGVIGVILQRKWEPKSAPFMKEYTSQEHSPLSDALQDAARLDEARPTVSYK